jgi:uncharacterized PurR-regulated membrane protein YhhQ (DUF165 family)
MESEMLFLGGYFLEIAVITILSKCRPHFLGYTVAANLCLVACLSQKQVIVFGLSSNATNIAYAGVVYAMSIIAVKHTFSETMNVVNAALLSLLLFIGVSLIITRMPIVSDNSMIEQMILVLHEVKIQIAVASFLAFYIANSINTFFISGCQKKMSLVKRKIIANFSCQFTDSIIFFPVAFWGMWSAHQIITATVSGIILKCALNLIDTAPFMLVANKKKTLAKMEESHLP